MAIKITNTDTVLEQIPENLETVGVKVTLELPDEADE